MEYDNIRTNTIEANFNYEKIKQDFFIYYFEDSKDKQFYKNSLLDKVKSELNALSVVYLQDKDRQNKRFYALFDKKNKRTEGELRKKFSALLEQKEYSNIAIELIDNFKEFVDKTEGNRVLLQLFINCLAISNKKRDFNKKCDFNNITGALYYVINKTTHQYKTLKINVDKNLTIKLDVVTFSCITQRNYMKFKGETKFEDLAQFKIESSTRKMTRHFSSQKENPEKIFVIRQIFKTRNTINFIDFDNHSKFILSKCGVLYQCLNELRKRFSDYLTIEFKTLDCAKSLDYLNDFSSSEDKVNKFRVKKPINIVDCVKNESSQALAHELIQVLQNKYYLLKWILQGNLNDTALNFRIIHDKNYYKDKGLIDDYLINRNNCNIQHITLEDFKIALNKKGKSPALDNIFKEFYIKQDIINGKISIIDWQLGQWIFVIENKHDKKVDFHELIVSTEGMLYFNVYTEQHKKYSEYFAYFKSYHDKNEKIECLIISNEDDINVIIDTGIFTMPDIQTIGDNLQKESNPTSYTKNQFMDLFNAFLNNYPKHRQDKKRAVLYDCFDNYADELTKKNINKIFKENKFNNNSGLRKDFNRFFQQKTGDILYYPSRNEDEKSNVNSNVGIYYHENTNKKQGIYFVGDCVEINGLKTVFAHSTHIRKVKVYKGKLIFKSLIPLLNVDFVKHKEYTVLPFPLKYLKEYANVYQTK